MIKKIEKIFNDEQFQPTILGLFINPFYIIRNGIYKNIVKHKKYVYGRVLDFGCGKKPYQNIFDEAKEYIGIDIETSGHSHTDSKIDMFYDGNKIPFPNKHFDSVFSSEVFEHIFNLEEILLEINRVLKPGGNLVITIPFAWGEHEIPYDYARYTSFAIKHILNKNGFELLVEKKTTNYVETLFQMWNTYIFESILPKHGRIKKLLTPIFIAPMNILGLILGYILPKNYEYYHNNFIVAKKIK
jgi:SAM-dependent methyltransferase